MWMVCGAVMGVIGCTSSSFDGESLVDAADRTHAVPLDCAHRARWSRHRTDLTSPFHVSALRLGSSALHVGEAMRSFVD